MYCPYINPETGKEYTYDYVCCNEDDKYKLCPIAKECTESFVKDIMYERKEKK